MNEGGHAVAAPAVWAVVAFLAGALVIMGPVAYAFVVRDPRVERRLYWGSWLLGGALLTLALTVREPRAALATALACLVVAVSFAFFKTSFLKIGGRIYALNPRRRQPDPARPPASAP